LNATYLTANAYGNATNGDVYLGNQGGVTLVLDNSAKGVFSLGAAGNINLGDHTGTYSGGDISANSIVLTASAGSINDYYSAATTLVAPSISLTTSGDAGNSTVGAIQTATANLVANAGGNVWIQNNATSNGLSYNPLGIVVTLAGGGSVELDSFLSDVHLLNANYAGTSFTLHAPDGSILNDPTTIVASTVNLVSGYVIGTSSSPIAIQATNLTAQANGGSAYIVEVSGDITLQGSNNATGGTFSLAASSGSILGASASLVSAAQTDLQAAHAVGSSSAAISLNTPLLNAQASSGGAWLSDQVAVTTVGNNSATGTFSLVSAGNITLGQGNNSAGGDIYGGTAINLNATGNIVDAYGVVNSKATLVSPDITLAATGSIGSAASSLGGSGPVYVTTASLNTTAGADTYVGNGYLADTNSYAPVAVTVTMAAGGCTTTGPCSSSSGTVVFDNWTSEVVINKIVAPVSVEVLAETGNIVSAFASTLANPNILTGATPTLATLQAHPAMPGAADITAVHGTVGSSDQAIWVADISSSVAKDDFNYTSDVYTTTGGITTSKYAGYNNGLGVSGGTAWINQSPASSGPYSLPPVPNTAPITTYTAVSYSQKVPSITVVMPIIPVGTPVQVAAPMVTVVQQYGMTLPDNMAPLASTQNASYGGTSESIVGGNPTEIGVPQSATLLPASNGLDTTPAAVSPSAPGSAPVDPNGSSISSPASSQSTN
jgi:filamentous hemagglutinin